MITDPSTYAGGVPYEEFRRRATLGAVSWVADGAGGGSWAVLSHRAVIEVSRQPERFSSAARGAFLADPRTAEDLERARQLLVNMDAPAHLEVRRHLSAAFTPRAVQQMARDVHRHAAGLVRRLVTRERFDAVGDLAAELPLLVLTDLLGMPRADRALLFRWSNNLVGFDDPEYGGSDVEVYRATFGEALGYARDLVLRRRRRPREDLVSRLVHSEVDGRRLSDSRLCQLWLLLVVAGNETTRHLISGALWALSGAPSELDRLTADPRSTPTAVDELLRWVSPIMQFRRTAVSDVWLSGQHVRAGDKLLLWYVAANRDPAVFRRPDRLRLDRRPNPHLSFGVGPHYCLGSHLAHLETRVVLDELRPHLGRLRALAAPTRLESNFMNGIKTLPMSLAS